MARSQFGSRRRALSAPGEQAGLIVRQVLISCLSEADRDELATLCVLSVGWWNCMGEQRSLGELAGLLRSMRKQRGMTQTELRFSAR